MHHQITSEEIDFFTEYNIRRTVEVYQETKRMRQQGMFSRLFKWATNSEKFICKACGQPKLITQRVCLDPQLCTTCVDEDNDREYKLTFGEK